MNARSFHLSVRGSNHIKKDKECQDASASYYDDDCAVAVVCDGHGGDDYIRSAAGSKIGCTVAEKNIRDFIREADIDTFLSAPERHLKNLEASIINDWNESVARYHEQNPFTEAELSIISPKARKKYVKYKNIESAYGTTMIAVAMTRRYWFGIHIGDGKCVAVNYESEFKQPIPWDDNCFLNVTTSICDSDAIDEFRYFCSEKLPAAVFVGSDGIDDCFSNNRQLNGLYKTVLYSFSASDFDDACRGLEDYLPRLSEKGSGDDVSVAAILDMERVPYLSVVKEFDTEKEKARIRENERRRNEENTSQKINIDGENKKIDVQSNTESAECKKKPLYCEVCGRQIKNGEKFCTECGTKVKYGTESTDVPENIGMTAEKPPVKVKSDCRIDAESNQNVKRETET